MITVQCLLWHTLIYPDRRLFSRPSEENEWLTCSIIMIKSFFASKNHTEDNIIIQILKQEYEFRTWMWKDVWEVQSLLTPVFWSSTLQMYYFFTLFSLSASSCLICSSGAVCTWENESHYNILVCDQAHSQRPEHMARQCACAKKPLFELTVGLWGKCIAQNSRSMLKVMISFM